MLYAPSVRFAIFVLTLYAFIATSIAHAAEPRPIKLDDLARIADVSDPQVSPEGAWVAYTVRTTNIEKDKRSRDIWMANWTDGRASHDGNGG
jgi:hypothetical protein